MPNSSVRAADEGLPKMTRRAFAAGLVAMPACTLGATAAAGLTLDDKIALYEEALAAKEVALSELNRLDDANLIQPPRVQFGRLHVGVDEQGKDRFEPLYAETIGAIEREWENSAGVHRVMWTRHPNFEAMMAKLRERYDALLDDFKSQEREWNAARDACGLTDAEARYEAACEASEVACVAVMEHDFQTVEEVRRAFRLIISTGGDEIGTSIDLGVFGRTLAGMPS